MCGLTRRDRMRNEQDITGTARVTHAFNKVTERT